MSESAVTNAGLILEQRQTVLDAAYRIDPERFARQAPQPAAVPTAVWINKPLNTQKTCQTFNGTVFSD